MKRKIRNNYIITTAIFLLFVIFTILVKNFDVKAVGPQNSLVGFSAINTFIFEILGQNPVWHIVSNLIGDFAILIALAFAVFGFLQVSYRKSITKIDADILALGVLYVLTVFAYIFFEFVVINYRPVLITGVLEASYPSSHTMLVFTIFGTAYMQADIRVKNEYLKNNLKAVLILAILATMIGRIASGVHWFTDVIGAMLLSSFLLMLYYSAVKHIEYKNRKNKIRKGCSIEVNPKV